MTWIDAWPRGASLARSAASTACTAQFIHPGATCSHRPEGRNDDSQETQNDASGADPLRSQEQEIQVTCPIVS